MKNTNNTNMKNTNTTHKIEKLGENYSVVTYFNDGYTSPNYHSKEFKVRSNAERYLENFKDSL